MFSQHIENISELFLVLIYSAIFGKQSGRSCRGSGKKSILIEIEIFLLVLLLCLVPVFCVVFLTILLAQRHRVGFQSFDAACNLLVNQDNLFV